MSKKQDKTNAIDFDDFIAPTPEAEKNKIRSMLGHKKMWKHFLSLTEKKEFIDDIKTIKEYNLNEQGWAKDLKKFRWVINNLCRKYGLDEIMWSEAMEHYITMNQMPEEVLSTPCIVLDREEIGEEEYPDGEYEDVLEEIPSEPVELDHWSYSHPVIIRVSPYASSNEIIDCIKKSYSLYIKPIQERYQREGTKIMGKGSSSVRERNKYILEIGDLSRKEIARKVYERFGIHIDEGHIGTIKSRGKKKRNIH